MYMILIGIALHIVVLKIRKWRSNIRKRKKVKDVSDI